MLSQLVPQLKKILEARPALKQKKELTVLLQLGATHTGVQHLLLNTGKKSKRVMNVDPVIFNFAQEGMRSFRFHKTIDDTIAAKIAFESLFDNVFRKQLQAITPYSYKIVVFERVVASRFDFNEMREMLESARDIKTFAALVKSELTEKGMAIPASETELDEILPKTLKRKSTPVPDASRIEKMNYYTLSWAVPKIIDKLCDGKLYRGDPPFEISYVDPNTSVSSHIEIRRSNYEFDIKRDRDYFSIKIDAADKKGLRPEYRFDLYEGVWRYHEPYFMSGHGFKHHAEGLRTLCKILLGGVTFAKGE